LSRFDHHGPRYGLRDDRRADQRHRLAEVPAAHRGSREDEAALNVALAAGRNGANLIDVNMDEGLLDGEPGDDHVPEPDRDRARGARIPVMVDSSKWSVIEAGLKCVQGKGVVNSISLKEGEEVSSSSRKVKRYGAGVVVMAFDEQGRPIPSTRKVEICGRAYNLLTSRRASAEDIIFDPNVLTVATGIEEHNGYAKSIHRGAAQDQGTLPGRRTGGGATCRSPSAATNPVVREAMHAAFLYHAIRRGLTWASSTPASSTCTRRFPETARARRGRPL
jgi:5-methyltetrahydrofolate--homocysteine methyltransferase